METAGRPLGRDRIAIAASIALHLCAVIALATLPRATFSTDDPDERLLLASTIRIERHPPAPRAPVHHTLVYQTEPAKPTPRPVIRTAVTVERAIRRLVVGPEAPNAYAPAIAAAPARPRTAYVSPMPATQPPPTQAEPASTPAPAAPSTAPSAGPVAAVAQTEEGIGNFGETYPASIEPALRSALAAIGSGFDVRVTVDENGRATAIEFMRSPPDTTLREELREKLLATRFIPAACNGLRCAGTVDFRT